MEYIISLIWTGMDMSATMILADGVFGRKRSLRTLSAAVLFFSAMSTMILHSVDETLIAQGITLFLEMFIIWWCYRTKLQYAMLMMSMALILSGILDTSIGYGICAFLGITYNEFVWKKVMYTVTVSCSKSLLLFLAYLIRKIALGRKHASIRRSWLLLTMLFPMFSAALLVFIFVTFQNEQDLNLFGVLFSVVLAAANVAILYILHILEKRTLEEEELHLLHQQMEIQTSGIVALEKSYRAQRAATHEFRNQLQTLGDLLAAGQAEQAHDYIRQLQVSETVRDLPVRTRHPIMDAILNQKYQLAQEHGIDVQFEVSDLSGLRMATDELVVLFANLLDNAIEGCRRLNGAGSIRCRVIHEDGLYLSVKNTAPPVAIENGLIRTTKQPPQEHGYGLMSIRRVLNGRNAEYSYDYKDGWFRFAAEIPDV